ncbi:MAG: RNA 3'-terminal phosphate cyclase [Gemmataceae bacterium]
MRIVITIDGSHGEGGGQIIRTALALSLVTGRRFAVENVRANRKPPGLRPQHLMAVKAAAQIGQARVEGAGVGARWFSFHPGRVEPGDYTFKIGTAGSTTLVLQTVLPPLMIATGSSHLTFEGGTHNVKAPPYEFIAESFLPLINQMGPRVEARLDRYGFYAPGGGRVHFTIEPADSLRRLDIPDRGALHSQRASALVVKLPTSIAEREIKVIREVLGWSDDQCEIEQSENALSPGNVVTLRFVSDHLTEVITAIGQRGVRAEAVAHEAAAEAQRYLESGAPVGEHLADQLLIPMALARGGSFVTGPLSLHTTTNMDVISKFLDVGITMSDLDGGRVQVAVA